MTLYNELPLGENTTKRVLAAEVLFEGSLDTSGTFTEMLNLLMTMHAGWPEATFSQTFTDGRGVAQEVRELIEIGPPSINPRFQDVKMEELPEAFLDMLRDDFGMKEDEETFYFPFDKEEDDIFDVLFSGQRLVERFLTWSEEPVGPLTTSLLGNKDDGADPPLSDYYRILKRLITFRHDIYLETDQINGVWMMKVNKTEEKTLRLLKDVHLYFYTKSVLKFFFEEVIDHFKNVFSLRIHTDGSGDMTFDDLADYPIYRGDARDIAIACYYQKFLKVQRSPRLLVEHSVEDMTFSFGTPKELGVDFYKDRFSYLKDTMWYENLDLHIGRNLDNSRDNINELIDLEMEDVVDRLFDRYNIKGKQTKFFRYMPRKTYRDIVNRVTDMMVDKRRILSLREDYSWVRKKNTLSRHLDEQISELEEQLAEYTESEE